MHLQKLILDIKQLRINGVEFLEEELFQKQKAHLRLLQNSVKISEMRVTISQLKEQGLVQIKLDLKREEDALDADADALDAAVIEPANLRVNSRNVMVAAPDADAVKLIFPPETKWNNIILNILFGYNSINIFVVILFANRH